MDALDHLLEALEEAKSSSLPAQVITAQLQQRVAKCSKTINDKHKEYYNALAKLGKALDKKFVIALDDVTDVKLFQSEIAQDALKRVVRDHLERTGECEVARMFEQVRETWQRSRHLYLSFPLGGASERGHLFRGRHFPKVEHHHECSSSR